MKTHIGFLALALLAAPAAQAQVENPDFRIRAQFRDSQGESVGNATVKVISRFLQVYYGGVTRSDEYRFQLEIDSPHYSNQSFDVKIDDFLVGTHLANSSGFLDVTYRSDFKPDDAPDLPLPVGFPDSIGLGNVVSLYDSLTQSLLLTSGFGEEFERGDSDHDGDVDDDDYHTWANGFGGSGFGPASGEYSGDNRIGGDDLLSWQRHFSGPRGGGGGGGSGGKGGGAIAVPEPACLAWGAILGAAAMKRRGQRRPRVR